MAVPGKEDLIRDAVLIEEMAAETGDLVIGSMEAETEGLARERSHFTPGEKNALNFKIFTKIRKEVTHGISRRWRWIRQRTTGNA